MESTDLLDQYESNFSKLSDNCGCYTCQHFTKSYLSHLVREKEMLRGTLISLHNIVYLYRLVEEDEEGDTGEW